MQRGSKTNNQTANMPATKAGRKLASKNLQNKQERNKARSKVAQMHTNVKARKQNPRILFSKGVTILVSNWPEWS